MSGHGSRILRGLFPPLVSVLVLLPGFALTASQHSASQAPKGSPEDRIEAVRRDDSAREAVLLASGVSPNSTDEHGSPAVFVAVGGGSIEVLKRLLAAGAEVDARDEKGWTPLLRAISFGHAESVRILLEAGADVNVHTPSGNIARSILHQAAETYEPVATSYPELLALLDGAGARHKIPAAEKTRRLIDAVRQGETANVDRLLAAGADPEAAGGDTTPVLFLAASLGHSGILEALLAAGADPDALDLAGQQTALFRAIQRADIGMVKALFAAGTSAVVIGRHGRPVELPLFHVNDPEMFEALRAGGVDPSRLRLSRLLYAARKGDLELLRHLLSDGKGIDVGEISDIPLIVEAAGAGQAEVVRELARMGVDLDAPASDASTAIMWAASRGHSEVVRELLTAGADPDARQLNGETGLHWSIDEGHEEIALTLIAAGAGLDLSSKWGRTPLHAAAAAGKTRIVLALLEAGAPVDSRDSNAQTALTLAVGAGHGEIILSLVKAGASREGLREAEVLRAVRVGEREPVEAYLAEGGDPSLADHQGCSLLWLAADSNQLEIAGRLLAAGSDPNKSCLEYPPLMTAAAGGHLELIELLLEAGAEVNAGGGFRWSESSLFAAVEGGHLETVHLLLAAGADPRPAGGGNLLDQTGDPEILALLRRALSKTPSPSD